MEARDGLLVRLKITGGVLPSRTALALADLSERHGNGLFDLSARANLQMRGVRDDTLAPLHEDLSALDLLDTDPAAESVRNVIASPLAGLGDGLDIRPIVTALESLLVGDRDLHALPGKFGMVVDDGGKPSLADIAADLRFDLHASGRFAVGLGGTRGAALFAGWCRPDDVVLRAAAIARSFLALRRGRDDIRRMAHARAFLGDERVLRACHGTAPPGPQPGWPAALDSSVAGSWVWAGRSILGLAAPFGRLSASMLREAAHLCCRTDNPSPNRAVATLRLTPWRTILVPGAGPARPDGFIVDPADPRLRVAACAGQAGCLRGTTDTHADAVALSDLAPRLGSGITIHVSGCSKGCAKPSPTTATLVGRGGRYDLVRSGRPGDMANLAGLTAQEVRTVLQDSAASL